MRILVIVLLLVVVESFAWTEEIDWVQGSTLDQRTESDQSRQPQFEQPGQAPPTCLRTEPHVRDVVEAAWADAGLSPDEDQSRKRRVRISGWLPKFSGGIAQDRGDRRDYRYEPGTARVDQLHQDAGFGWDVGLSWDSSKAVFHSGELQVAREASRRARERMDLAAEVIRLYFSRKRLIGQGLPPSGSDHAVRLAEVTATLNVWTGNRFEGRWCSPEDTQP